MSWKPEYAEARKKKSAEDPEYRAKRNAQSAKNKEARKAYMAEYYKNNPDKFPRRTPEQQAEYNARRRAKYAENKEHREAIRVAVKEWQQANPRKRKSQRIKKYGITHEQFMGMLDEQDGRCAICGHMGTEDRNFFPLVDHCHSTNKVRGLLCMNCNQGLGKFMDSPRLLQAAAEYLLSRG